MRNVGTTIDDPHGELDAACFRFAFGSAVAVALAIIVAAFWGCSRHDVGDENNNPAPTANATLPAAQALGDRWAREDMANRRWSTPTPTSSMVPYCDSHSVLLLERVADAVRIHDIVVMDEGPGRENVCHQVVDVKDGHAFMDGKNNLWPDGWFPLTAMQWRVAGIIYSKG